MIAKIIDYKVFYKLEYRHFITSFVAAVVVVAACLSEYGVTAATVIFCSQWALLCQAWFVTTLPAMSNAMRTIAWIVFAATVLLFGRQLPYMINSPVTGESFTSFMFIMIIFLGALIASAHLPKKEK